MRKFTLTGFLNLFTPKYLLLENSNGVSSFKRDFSKINLKEKGDSNRSRSKGMSSFILLFILFLFSNFLSAQAVDFSQGANNNGTLGNVEWINGILNSNNSKYYEGMATFQRLVITNIPPSTIANGGNSSKHTFQIKMEAAKGGYHSYDFMTSWDNAKEQADLTQIGLFNNLNECDGLPNSLTPICETLHAGTNFLDLIISGETNYPLPGDIATTTNVINSYQSKFGTNTLRAYGSSPITWGEVKFVKYEANEIYYDITWISNSPTIILEFAAHIAAGLQAFPGTDSYGAGRGAGDINGGPYHVSVIGFSTGEKNSGNLDNQLQGSSIFQKDPPCDIIGTFTMCQGETSGSYSGPPGLDTYTWSISPAGATLNVDPNNPRFVTVTSNTPGDYILKLVTTSGTNTSTANCTATLKVNPKPIISGKVTDIVCFGTLTGAIDVTMTSAVSYAYLWTGTGVNSNSEDQSGLSAGDYTLKVTDSNGCISEATFTITESQIIPIVINCAADVTKSACEYASQAELDAAFATWLTGFTATGGNGALVPSGLTGLTAPDLCAGGSVTVNFSVFDGCGKTAFCSATFSINKGEAVTVAGPTSIDKAVCDYTDQAGLTAAYNAWLAEFKITNAGCNATGNFISAPPTEVNFCSGADITLTFKASDACTDASITRTFKVTKADQVAVAGPSSMLKTSCDYKDQAEVDAAFNTWLEEFKTVNVGCNASAVMNPSSPIAPILCEGGSVTVSYSIEDNCNQDSVSATFSIDAPTTIVISSPSDLIVKCDQDKEALFAQWKAEFSYTGGCDNAVVTDLTQFTMPEAGVPLVVEYVVEDNCQKASVKATFSIDFCESLCTYTQGYYGNAGGKSCAMGVTYSTSGLISKALMSYPLGTIPETYKMTIGLPGKSVSMSNNPTDIAKIIEFLPGGGSSLVLSTGDFTINNMPNSYLKKGNVNNTLLAQTITLGLNLGIDSALGNFILQAGKLATAAPQGGCGSKIPMPRSCSYDIYTPTINEYKYFDIPTFVNGKTVKQLFDMANDALGGKPLPAGVTLSSLANAVDVINNAFDGCRISMGYNQTPLKCIEDRAAFIVDPVPSLINPTVTYKFSYTSDVTIEVWNMSGGKLHTQFDTNSYLDKKVNINYPFTTTGAYIMKIITNIGSSTRTVIKN